MTAEKTVKTNVITEQSFKIARKLKDDQLCFLNRTRLAKDVQIFREFFDRHAKTQDISEEPLVLKLNEAKVKLSFDIKVSSNDDEAYVSYVAVEPLPGASEEIDFEKLDRDLKMLIADSLIAK